MMKKKKKKKKFLSDRVFFLRKKQVFFLTIYNFFFFFNMTYILILKLKQRFCGTYLAFMIQLATILHHYYLFKLEN